MVDQAEQLRRLVSAVPQQRKILRRKRILRVITVTSGKGGVGKTSVVINLAIALALLGKRVVIMDADLGLANVDVIIGLVPVNTLHDVIRGKKTLTEIIITGPEGVKIIPGASGLEELANLTGAQRERMIESLLSLEDMADILLIDTGAGLSQSVLSFVSAADELIVVTTSEPTAITDAYGIIKVVAKNGLHRKAKLIVNQVKNSAEGKEIAERFAQVSKKFLDLELQYLGEICSDQHVVSAVKQQQPFITLYPRAKAAQNVRAIAARLMDLSVEKPGGVRGFVSRLTAMLAQSPRSGT